MGKQFQLERDKHVHDKRDNTGLPFRGGLNYGTKIANNLALMMKKKSMMWPANHGGVIFVTFLCFFCVKVQQILLLFSLISWFSNPLSHFSPLAHRRIFSPVNGPTFFSHDWVSSWWFLHPSNYFQHFYQIFDHFNRLIWFLGKQLIWELVQARFSIKLFRKLNSSILNNSTNQLVLEELKQ